MKKIDLTGKKQGRLLIVKFLEKRGKHLYWNARCDCGKETEVSSTNFNSGKSKSCGCLRSNSRKGRSPVCKKEKGEGSMSCLINRYVQTAKSRDLSWELSREKFKELTSSNCYYCGAQPVLSITGPRSNGEYVFNGIDRVDSNVGYIESNCVPCCNYCNKAKLDHTEEKFYDWVKRISSFLKQDGRI